MSTVISVENLSKSYRLGTIGGGMLSDDLSRWWARLRQKPDPNLKIGEEHHARHMGDDFWALQDVSFQVKEGEILGIIGRNGAGKSTLLKILSRVTGPTSGYVKIKGRIASLLEVGTGFHPELTGRENVFLNGAILGMTKAEIRRKFDEIVAFAEIEEFIDTPVKRYSSGMYVRLAFAVAAHLEPEILILDEVLTVGDAQFQKKCLGKMDEVSRKGRTVLFVSHNMAIVGKLCHHTLLLNDGRIQLYGATDNIIPQYLKSGTEAIGFRNFDDAVLSIHDPRFKIQTIRILDPDGAMTGHVDIRRQFTIEIEYRILQTLPQYRIALRLVTSDGTIAFVTSDSAHASYEKKSCDPGNYKARCFIPGKLLNEGTYSLTLSADIPFQKALFLEENAVEFHVEQTGGVNARFPEKWPGVVCPQLEWETERLMSQPTH
jgi:lipopolysaccharide transport system ATP-binding protein